MNYTKGEKFIWKPINRATKQRETEHPHYGKRVTVIDVDYLDTVWVSVDDFPKVNDKNANRFLAQKDELEREMKGKRGIVNEIYS